jgi:DHA3 family macrolide efflux protein-like MFS transporter
MLSQLVTVLGSSFSIFAMNVWVYQQGGGISEYALLNFAAYLPGALVSLFAGGLIEPLDKRKVIFIADGLQALCTLILAFMWFASLKTVYLIVLVIALQSILDSFQWIATQTLTLYLSQDGEGLKANTYLETIRNIVRISAPGLSSILAATFGLGLVFSLDFLCFGVASLLLFKVNPPKVSHEISKTKLFQSFIDNAKQGFHWIIQQKEVYRLLLFFSVINLAVGIITTASPLFFIGAIGDVGYGLSLSGFSAGMIFGGFLISKIDQSRKNILKYLIIFEILYGLMEIALGLATQKAIFVGAMFVLGSLVSASNILNATLWQELVPAALSSRVFSLRRSVALALTPLAAILTPPLVYFFSGQDSTRQLALLLKLSESDSSAPIRMTFIMMGLLIVGLSLLFFPFKSEETVSSRDSGIAGSN